MAKKRGPTKRGKSLVEQLKNLVASLPTEAEKQEIKNNLSVVGSFFLEMRQLLDAFPTAANVSDVQTAATKLTEVLDRIEANPQVASILGIRHQATRPRILQPSEADIAEAKSELTRLRLLPVDEIRQDLLRTSHSASRLRAIAAALGVKTDTRVGRDAMAHQIAMSIANYRGYEQLSGQGEPPKPREIKTDSDSIRKDAESESLPGKIATEQ